jgi:hypothetical protein
MVLFVRFPVIPWIVLAGAGTRDEAKLRLHCFNGLLEAVETARLK